MNRKLHSEKRILVVFPNNPSVVDGGAQLRCIQVLDGFLELGCRTRLLHPGELKGGFCNIAKSDRRSTALFDSKVIGVSKLDNILGGVRSRIRSFLSGERRLARSNFYSPIIRYWFSHQLSEFRPDIIWMLYLHPHYLLEGTQAKGVLTVIDCLDLTSKHQVIYKRACELVHSSKNSNQLDLIDEKDLREDYYDTPDFDAAPEEFKIINKYDVAVAISPVEAQIIANSTDVKTVFYLPLTCKIPTQEGLHNGGPICILQYHEISHHCYLYFVNRVLPMILQKIPDFKIRVIGTNSNLYPATEGVELVGYVSDIDKELDDASFLILPVFGMTGQQTRVIYSMARGVPVATLSRAAASAGVVHMKNGTVANNAEELAKNIILMHSDNELCRRMGAAAKKSVDEGFSDSRLSSELQAILSLQIGTD
jgi:glycosyltransferase involved in cell wall biosynthesis